MKKTFHTIGIWSAVLIIVNAYPLFAENSASWIKPVFFLREEYDDNIFLTRSDTSSDWVTVTAAGVHVEPELARHQFTADYVIDTEMFSRNSGQNTTNQTLNAQGVFVLNKWRVRAGNRLRHYESRTGSEDTARVPRTGNQAYAGLIYGFNKLDAGFTYVHSREDYRTTRGIGDYNGQALTYQDLDADEQSGEIETAFHFWPKTSWLFSARYGEIRYDTGRKSGSEYFDVLTGLRGRFFAKGEIEGKIGYRDQNYLGTNQDFNSVIANLSLTERFTARDTVTLEVDRVTHATIYQQNAYFESTHVSGGYTRQLNDRVSARVTGAWWLNTYPAETVESGKTVRRRDDLWRAGAGLTFALPRWGAFDLEYMYMEKASNVEAFEYRNNRVSLAFRAEF